LKTSPSFSSIADKEGELQIFLSTSVEALPQSKLAENATELKSKKANGKKPGSEYMFFIESAIEEIFPPSKRIRLRSASKSNNFGATNKSVPSHKRRAFENHRCIDAFGWTERSGFGHPPGSSTSARAVIQPEFLTAFARPYSHLHPDSGEESMLVLILKLYTLPLDCFV
jgi:hypothetical protein